MKEFSNFLSLKRFNLVFLSIAACSLSVFFILINEPHVFADKEITATPIDQYSVRLTWAVFTPPPDRITLDYEISYKESTSANYLIFNDGVSLIPIATVTGLKSGTTYNFQVKALLSPAGKSNMGTVSATTLTETSEDKINPPPTIEGIGFYEILIDDNYEANLKPEKFGDYFPYSTFSDSLDFQNYGESGKYRKEGFYVFTHERTTSIHTYFGLTDKPIQLQVRLKDDESSSHVQTVVLYTNIRDTSDKKFSDAYIAFDRYQPLMVFDPNHLFKEVKANESIENGEYWAIFDLVFAKPMKKSDIIIEAWDDSRTTVAAKIVDAWEINETPTLLLTPQKIIIPHEAASTVCQENNSCFSPHTIQVSEGSTVTWLNEDTFIHTITSGAPENGPDKKFRKVLFSEESFDYTFCCKGTYKYYCEIHPWAVGMVTVTGEDPHAQENFEIKVYVPHGSLKLKHNAVLDKEDTLHKFDITGTISTKSAGSVVILISKPDDQTITKRAQTDDSGRFYSSLSIDKTWQRGSYTISVKHANHLIGSISFTVV